MNPSPLKTQCCGECLIHLPYKTKNEFQCANANCPCHTPTDLVERLKERAKADWNEIVKFCNERKDGPSAFMHESFLDTLVEEIVERTREQAIEPVAKAIYAEMSYYEDGAKPEWTENGNSFKQEEARRKAVQALTPPDAKEATKIVDSQIGRAIKKLGEQQNL